MGLRPRGMRLPEGFNNSAARVLDSLSISFLTARMNVSELSAVQLRRAAALKGRLEKLQKELTKLLGTITPPLAAPKRRRKKRTMSAAARKKLSEFHKARWAKIKAAQRKK